MSVMRGRLQKSRRQNLGLTNRSYIYEGMERVVTKKDTNVYLKESEDTEYKGGKPKEIGHARTKDLHAMDILIYPKRTSLFI